MEQRRKSHRRKWTERSRNSASSWCLEAADTDYQVNHNLVSKSSWLHTSNLTLGVRSGHALWLTERENLFNQSGFTKARLNTLTRRLSRSVTFAGTTREESGGQMHSNEQIPVYRRHKCILHRLSGANSHKFTEKAESACWENAVAFLRKRRWDLQTETELLAR